MAKKNSTNLSLSHWIKFRSRGLIHLGLALLTAFLCTVVPPFLVKTSSISLAIPTQSSTWDLNTLLEKGKTLYEQGQFASAINIWQQAASALALQGEPLTQARVLNDLSLAYQHLGQFFQASEAITKGLGLLKGKDSNSKERLNVKAQLLNTQGRLQLAEGQPSQALSTWQRAANTYNKAGSSSGVILSLINQAQALQSLGNYRKALDTLTTLRQQLIQQPDSLLKATALRSLGNAEWVVGDFKKSRLALMQSFAIARQSRSHKDMGEAFLSLGNLARAQQNPQSALTFYKQAAATEVSLKVESELNQLNLLLQTQQIDLAQALVPHLRDVIANLPLNHDSIFNQINLAESLTRLRQISSTGTPSRLEIANLLATAEQQAKTLGDQRAEAYALGALGGLYEQTHQWSDAQSLTEQALIKAQSTNAPDIGYRWQWQLGRLLKAQGHISEAITAYSSSVEDLKIIRNNLAGVNADIQFNFREQVEPVYRQLVDLLLQSKHPSQSNLLQARETIEALQLAELDNFFREACLENKPVELDQVVDQQDPTAAVIYPIILPNRLAVILKLPGEQLHFYQTGIAQTEVEEILTDLRRKVIDPDREPELQSLFGKVYNWLIRPAEGDLSKFKVQTLVFVLDGALRNIPMAALYDGKNYLIQKYASVLNLGLELLSSTPLNRIHLKALTAGVSLARPGFDSLPSVKKELADIKDEIPSTELLNQNFTIESLEKEIKSTAFPIVHLATHGQFSSQPDQTFILAWDHRIFVNQLNALLQSRDTATDNPIELLVLSACETAAGDKRAALGLAGVAVRAGARSTVASLWSVKDDSTSILMKQFYANLPERNMTKAEALRQAQLALLKTNQYSSPSFWAPYVLVGNWR